MLRWILLPFTVLEITTWRVPLKSTTSPFPWFAQGMNSLKTSGIRMLRVCVEALPRVEILTTSNTATSYSSILRVFIVAPLILTESKTCCRDGFGHVPIGPSRFLVVGNRGRFSRNAQFNRRNGWAAERCQSILIASFVKAIGGLYRGRSGRSSLLSARCIRAVKRLQKLYQMGSPG
jgi:hypothetical protein